LHQATFGVIARNCFLHSLIRIKDRTWQFGKLPRNSKEVVMPVDSILVSAAVVSVFVIFAGVMIWGDFHSGQVRQQPVGRNTKRRSF
jgi:hypothetical protein